MLALVAERKKIAAQFPNMVDYESKQALPALLRFRAHARSGLADQGHRGREGLFGIRRVDDHAPLQALEPRELEEARARCASASRACSTCT